MAPTTETAKKTTETAKKAYLLSEGDHAGFDADGTRRVFVKGDVILLSDESARNLGKRVIGPLTTDELAQLEGEKELIHRLEVRQQKEEVSRVQKVVAEVKASAVKTKETEEDTAEGEGGEGGGEVDDNTVDTLGETKFATSATKRWAAAQGLTDKDFEGMEPSSESGFTKEDAKAALEAREAIEGQE